MAMREEAIENGRRDVRQTLLEKEPAGRLAEIRSERVAGAGADARVGSVTTVVRTWAIRGQGRRT
jgi:hypothetical protein